jgi:hypothetical protein
VQDLRAVGEKRRKSLSEIESSLIEFSERGNQARRGAPLVGGETVNGREEIAVRQPGKVLDIRGHSTSIPCDFSRL